MPPKKKQQAHNAYYFFMQEFKNRQGRSFKSMQDVSIEAAPHWAALSKKEREPYEQLAAEHKQRVRGAILTSDLEDVSQLEQEERDSQEQKQFMKNDIEKTLMILKKSNKLEQEMFFIVHCNSFCEHMGVWYPAEIGIAAFSLLEGVDPDNVFHALIHPGSLPLGFAATAKQHSEATHQLEPPSSLPDCENNMQEVFNEIVKFLMARSSTGKLPYLYAEQKNQMMVSQIFEMWCGNYGKHPDFFTVYNLQVFFKILRNTVAGRTEWASDTPSYMAIEQDVYNYTTGIACEEHESIDVVVFCSKSIATRYCYVLCDYCCQDLDIEMIPGRHVPKQARVTKEEKSDWVEQRSHRSSKASSIKSSTTYAPSIRADTDTNTLGKVSESSKWETSSTASSSVNFGDLDDFPILGGRGIVSEPRAWEGYATNSSSFEQNSYAGAACASPITTSGFSKRPAALPHVLSQGIQKLSLKSENFPALSVGRGRLNDNGLSAAGARGVKLTRGRGHPFRKLPNEVNRGDVEKQS